MALNPVEISDRKINSEWTIKILFNENDDVGQFIKRYFPSVRFFNRGYYGWNYNFYYMAYFPLIGLVDGYRNFTKTLRLEKLGINQEKWLPVVRDFLDKRGNMSWKDERKAAFDIIFEIFEEVQNAFIAFRDSWNEKTGKDFYDDYRY